MRLVVNRSVPSLSMSVCVHGHYMNFSLIDRSIDRRHSFIIIIIIIIIYYYYYVWLMRWLYSYALLFFSSFNSRVFSLPNSVTSLVVIHPHCCCCYMFRLVCIKAAAAIVGESGGTVQTQSKYSDSSLFSSVYAYSTYYTLFICTIIHNILLPKLLAV